MKKKVAKTKPYKPIITLAGKQEIDDLLYLLNWANIHYKDNDKAISGIVKDFALQFAQRHTKKLIWHTLVTTIPLKPYEALLLYKIILAHHKQEGLFLHAHFMWEIDQNLVA